MKTTYKLGSFCFEITHPEDWITPANMNLFISNEKPDYYYCLHFVGELPRVKGNLIFQKKMLAILKTKTGEARYIGVEGRDHYYGLYVERDSKHADIYYLYKDIEEFSIDPFFVSLFAFEKHLICYSEMVLHCAYMIHNGEAILFSAPSETGKSTQASLWEKYRGSRVINGDKSLLNNIDGKWYANGWPICGSSGICFNESYPIKCIVMLSQAKENCVEVLESITAFKQLYSQITNNVWNTEFNLKVMDLIDQLIKDVPIYHIACNISEDAVNVLEKEIYK